MTERQSVAPWHAVERLLGVAEDLVLVGGQALGFWMRRYGIVLPDGMSAMSRDIDFLTKSAADKASVHRIARAIGGRAEFPDPRSHDILVGQARKELSETELLNVDVLFRLYGSDRRVHERAIEVRLGKLGFRVIDPIDLLKSRLDNLYALPNKQNEQGCAQLELAIEVVRAFMKESKKPLREAKAVEKLARSDAGRKVAKRFGIHVADAIDPDAIANRSFHEKKLPQLLRLMSASRALR